MKRNRSQQGAQDPKPLAPFWWRDHISMRIENAATRARDHRVLCEALADMQPRSNPGNDPHNHTAMEGQLHG